MPRLEVASADTLLPTIEPPLSNWSRDIATGETLDTVLEEAGLSATDRAEVALALGAEYDLRRLRPGHSVTVVSAIDGSPRSVALSVEDGVRIEAIFGEELATQVVTPDPDFITLAGEAVIDSSIFGDPDAGLDARRKRGGPIKGERASKQAAPAVHRPAPKHLKKVRELNRELGPSDTGGSAAELGLIEGAWVRHQRFGTGQVVKLEGKGVDQKAEIRFEQGGVKKLLLRFAKLEVVADN